MMLIDRGLIEVDALRGQLAIEDWELSPNFGDGLKDQAAA